MSEALAVARRNSCGWQPGFAVCDFGAAGEDTDELSCAAGEAVSRK